MKYWAIILVWLISFNGIVIQHDTEGEIQAYVLSGNEAEFIGLEGFAVFYDVDRREYDRTRAILTGQGFNRAHWKIVNGKLAKKSSAQIFAAEEAINKEIRAETMIYEKLRALAIKDLKIEGSLPEDFR